MRLTWLLKMFLVFSVLPLAQGISAEENGANLLSAARDRPAAEPTEDFILAETESREFLGTVTLSSDPHGVGFGDLTVMQDLPPQDALIVTGFEFRQAMERLAYALDDVPGQMAAALRAADENGELGWVAWAFASLAAALALGWVTARWLGLRAAHRLLAPFPPAPPNRATRYAYILVRIALGVGQVVVATAIAFAVLFVLDQGHPGVRAAALAGLQFALVLGAMLAVLRAALLPRTPAYRALAIDNTAARRLTRQVNTWLPVPAFLAALATWVNRLESAPDLTKILAIAASTTLVVVLLGIALANRRAISAAIRGADVAVSRWRGGLALAWPAVLIAYLGFALLATVTRLALDMPAATGLVVAPLEALLFGAFVHAVLVCAIDTVILPRRDTPFQIRKLTEDLSRLDQASAEEPDQEANEAAARAQALDQEAARAPFRALLDRGVAIVTLVSMAIMLLWAWGVRLGDERSYIANVAQISVVLFLAYMIYNATRIAIDRQILLEEAPEESNVEASSEDMMGKPGSRLGTLLPIFRGFLLAFIVLVASMIALSEAGVNIAPLFAGAGVIGLAVSFGAQSLIRDIFSGAFYLLDDAFRKGEYIDVGSAKGTVEKISVRSMQLRHHRGPLATVPFGEIQGVTNFSRDWAIMKLAFRVPFDTDVEQVRKLIKKFGQSLMEDPYYGPMFLQQVKSQGIVEMDDSAMIVRAKFMTKPGKQFEVRKVVYKGIRDLFEKEGIHFASRQVLVRVANDEEEMTTETQHAAAGAVLPLIEAAQQPSGANKPKDDR